MRTLLTSVVTVGQNVFKIAAEGKVENDVVSDSPEF